MLDLIAISMGLGLLLSMLWAVGHFGTIAGHKLGKYLNETFYKR